MLKKIVFGNVIENDAVINNVILSYDIDYSDPFPPVSIDGLEVTIDHTITKGQIFGKLLYTHNNNNYEKEFIVPVEKDVSVIRSKPAPKYRLYMYLTSSKEPAIRVEDVLDRETNEPLESIHYYFIDKGLVIAKGVIEDTDKFSVVLKTKPQSGKFFIFGYKDGQLTSVSERHILLKPIADDIVVSIDGKTTLTDDDAHYIDLISGAGDIISYDSIYVGSNSSIAISRAGKPSRVYLPSSILRNERTFEFNVLVKKPSGVTRKFIKKIDVYNTYKKYELDAPTINVITSDKPKTLLGKVAVTKNGLFILANGNILGLYKIENNDIVTVKDNLMLLESDNDIDTISVGLNEVLAYPYKGKAGLYYLYLDRDAIRPLLYNPERKLSDANIIDTKAIGIVDNERIDMLLNTKYLDNFVYPELSLEDGSYLVRYGYKQYLIFKDNGKFIIDGQEYNHSFNGQILEIKTLLVKTGVFIIIRTNQNEIQIIRINTISKIASLIKRESVNGNAFILVDIYNNIITIVKG